MAELLVVALAVVLQIGENCHYGICACKINTTLLAVANFYFVSVQWEMASILT